jgi:hypothetical protein
VHRRPLSRFTSSPAPRALSIALCRPPIPPRTVVALLRPLLHLGLRPPLTIVARFFASAGMAGTLVQMPNKPRLSIDPSVRATSVIVLSPNFIDAGMFIASDFSNSFICGMVLKNNY